MSKESQQKQEAKKQKVIDSNQRTIQDYLKQKLSLKKKKSHESTSNESFSKNLKVPQLSTRSIASDPFSFSKTSSQNDCESPSKLPTTSDILRPSSAKS